MTDNDQREENTSPGNEWEVVSLTASAYAAAPGPKSIELSGNESGNTYGEEAETSHVLFMSGHFVFPPSQQENLPFEPDIPPRKHENLPLVPENSDNHNDSADKDVMNELGAEEGGKSSGKSDEHWTLEGLTVPDEFPGIQYLGDKGNRLSLGEFKEDTALQGLNLVDQEQRMYSLLHSETTLGDSTPYSENTAIPGLIEPSEQGFSFGHVTQSSVPPKDENFNGSGLPCDAWWKRRVASVYAHAKEANSFWSIFVAAAVMGFVILGQRWQQERWQALQHKWHLNLNNEKTGRILGPVSRLKDVIVGGQLQGSFIRGSSSSGN